VARRAYVTLVTNDDFATGALTLAKSIRACGGVWPLVVMTTFAGRSIDALADLGCEIRPVTPPAVSAEFGARHGRAALHREAPFDKGGKPSFHDPLDNFCKLRLWQMTDLERAVFLDADTLMVANADRLFDYPAFSAAPNVYQTLADFGRMNSGVFVAAPDKPLYDAMLARLDRPGVFWRRTDQTFLQDYFPEWHGLPCRYNMLQYVYFQLPELWDWPQIRIVHYQYEKPWQDDHPKRDQLQPLIDLWWHVAEHSELPADGRHSRAG